MGILNFETRPQIQRPARGNGMGIESRYVSPPKCKDIPDRFLKYEYAEDLAESIAIETGMRAFCVVSGNFIFGDLIEAIIVKNNFHVKKLNISTLSLSQANIDSLENLLQGDYVDELNLVVSDYFFAHERRGLVKYAYDRLDTDNKFQLCAAGTHCKVISFNTHCGLKVVIHGSSNLRSSGSIEQFVIEENESVFDFNEKIFQAIIQKYQTIKKSVRRQQLWQVVAK